MNSEIFEVLDYFNEIKDIKVLSSKQEQALFSKLKKGDQKARTKLIEHNLKLVIPVVKKHMAKGLPIKDLIQEGNIGLIMAVDKFNPDLGYKFSTYATKSIDRTIRRARMDQVSLVRWPNYFYTDINDVVQKMESLTKILERNPTIDEISNRTGKSPKIIEIYLEIISRSFTSLDELNSDMSLFDLIEDKNMIDVETEAINNIESHIDLSCYDLSKKERLYFTAWSGIEDGIKKKFSDVANIYGTSRQNVTQTVKNAQKKLKIQIKK